MIGFLAIGTEFDSLATCIRLPTNKSVLARYSHLRSDAAGDQSARDLFKVVLSELKVVWEKTGIPIHAFTALRRERDRPEEPLFKRFKQDFTGFDINYFNLTFFEWPMNESSPIYEQAKSKLGTAMFGRKKTFPTEDYRELVEFTLIYLGDQLPDGCVFKFRIPGALHHARLMAQSIYLLKIHLLSALLSMSTKETRIVYRMANCIALFYSKLFFRSRISVFAPTVDLQFLTDDLQCIGINKKIW